MIKSRPLLTFTYIYRLDYLWHLLMYWNYLPFFAYLFILLGQALGNDVALLVSSIAAVIILVINQLYLWYFAFFTAQEASLGFVGVPELVLSEAFVGFGVKLKLTAIRLGYYLGLLLVLPFLVLPVPTITFILAILVAGIYFLLVDNFILPAALYQFSYHNSLLAAFNPAPIARFLVANFWDLVVICGLNTAFYLVGAVVGAVVSLSLAVPIFGIVLLSLFNGFIASWNAVYIPSVLGQVWGKYHSASDQS